MNETINIDRDKKNPRNSLIYKYLKEEELAGLTDQEFAILQNKFRALVVTGSTGSLYAFQEGPDAGGIHGDAAALGIYRRSIAASPFYFDCFYRYSRIFTLCYRLGARNLYDIGCGQQMQGFLMIYAPELTYTGIDMNIFREPFEAFSCQSETVNEWFEKFTGCDRIRHMKETYPCELTVKPENAAILLGVFLPEDKIHPTGAAMAKDFERVVISIPTEGRYRLDGMTAREIIDQDLDVWSRPFEHLYARWREAMPGFEFYRLSDGVVLGTKCPEDRRILETKYTVIGDRILADVSDVPWYNMLAAERM